MKNKSTMLLVGIGVAYLLYRLYAKKSILPPGILQTIEKPLALYPIMKADTEQIISNQVPTQFLVDKVRDEAIPFDMPNTYQTFYGRPINNIAGSISRVPSTC